MPNKTDNSDKALGELFANADFAEFQTLDSLDFTNRLNARIDDYKKFRSLMVEGAQYMALSIIIGLVLLIMVGAVKIHVPSLTEYEALYPRIDAKILLFGLIALVTSITIAFANQE